MQYRRLTAHLQTGSADFNRRLSAYLTNHVAMRSALDQAISNSYAQQYPNAPQFAHNQPGMYPSPFNTQGMTPAQSPQSYMQPHFQSANPVSFRPPSVRPVSTAGQPSPGSYVQSPSTSSPVDANDQRRGSIKSKSTSPVAVRTPQSMHAGLSYPQVSTSYQTKQIQAPVQIPSSSQSQQIPPTPTSMYSPHELGPLSATLPPESQQLLASALDPKDPMSSMLMGGHDNFTQSYWAPSFVSPMKTRNFHPSYNGMSATLAPSALDIPPQPYDFNHSQSASSLPMNNQSFVTFDGSMPDFSKAFFHDSNSSHGSGTATPGLDGGWDAFIDHTSWENTT